MKSSIIVGLRTDFGLTTNLAFLGLACSLHTALPNSQRLPATRRSSKYMKGKTGKSKTAWETNANINQGTGLENSHSNRQFKAENSSGTIL